MISLALTACSRVRRLLGALDVVLGHIESALVERLLCDGSCDAWLHESTWVRA